MRAAFISIILSAIAPVAFAQPGWKDCATAQQYRSLHDGEWQEHTGAVKLCYDTHAFRFKTPGKTWYTGIIRYTQHLENGYLVEEFFSEENNKHPDSELRFHIVRCKPAVVTIHFLATGETWQMQSGELPEIKLETSGRE